MTDPQAPTDADVRVELKRLAAELEQANTSKHRAEIMRLADRWLDERLSQSGAHNPACRCEDCVKHLSDILARAHPDDTAHASEWGAAG